MSLSKQKSLAAELETMLNTLDEKDLADIPKIIEFKKSMNPYGRTIEGSDQYLSFSITQIQHEYWKKFITTAMVGFLNRMVDEWKVPEGVPVVPVYEYLDHPEKVEVPEMIASRNDRRAIQDYEFNKEWMSKRVIVKEFLEEMFQFNPDEHTKSAYRPNRADKDRKPVETEAGQLAVQHLKHHDKDFANKELLYEEVKQLTPAAAPKKTKQKKVIIKNRKTGEEKVVYKEVPAEDYDASQPTGSGADVTVKDTVREMIPPHDTFGRFTTYYKHNYEELRDAVKDLYCEKPEFELAINPYAIHNSKEDAEKFKKKHANEVIAEIFTADTGKWNFFDSFKEQRESVNFYNDNTIVLEEMVKQLERDERLGQDLMKKRVEKAKKKNVLLDGPDADGFKKWRDQNTEINRLGMSHIGGQADDDCDDGAVQVDVWRIAKGGLEVTKSKFFSQAEAPTFVQEAQEKAMASGAMKIPDGVKLPESNPANN